MLLALLLLFPTRAWSASHTRFTTVVIDAGHGGFDRGGIPRQRVAEKTVALDVAQRLRRALDRQGYRTIMTRDDDYFVPLPRRVAIANSYKNAIFVSVHFNSARRIGANGIETYFYSSESAPLAVSIHRHVLAGAPSDNRGIRQRGYYVLRKTKIPAVLVECGFLTNPHEAELAQTAGYRQKLADEIAQGIRGQPTLAERRAAPSRERVKPGVYLMTSNGTSVLAAADDNAASSSHPGSAKKKSSVTTQKKSSSKKSAQDSTKKESSSSRKKSPSSETKKPEEPNE